MLSKVLFGAALLAVCLGAPAPDAPVRGYGPPQTAFFQPQQRYEQPIQQPQPQYSQPSPQYQQPRSQPRYEEPSEDLEPPKYEFDYIVKDDYSGNDFGHQEKRDGYRTDGSYYVLLPDGRRQTVTYYVDGDSGFVAEVSYEGEAQFPESQRQGYQSQPQASYQQPQQTYQQPQQTYQQPQQRFPQAPNTQYGLF